MDRASGFKMLELSANMMGRQSLIYPTLIWDHDQLILVDAGFPGQLPQIKAAIQQAGFTFEKLTAIIITHHDIDHIGSLASVLSALPGQVRVLAHADEKVYVQGDQTPLKLAAMQANLASLPEETRAVYERLKRGFQSSFAAVDQTLVDGQVLPYLGGITVVFTPGHTLGHICLYLQDAKILIAGDTLVIENGELTPSSPSINYDNELAKKSLKKLTGYDIQTVICYHSGLYADQVNQRIASLTKE